MSYPDSLWLCQIDARLIFAYCIVKVMCELYECRPNWKT